MSKPLFVLGINTLQFESSLEYDLLKPTELTQVTDRTAANTLVVEDQGAFAIGKRPLSFPMATYADWVGLDNWVRNICQGAAIPFEYIDEQGQTLIVRYVSGLIPYVRKTANYFRLEFELEVVA